MHIQLHLLICVYRINLAFCSEINLVTLYDLLKVFLNIVCKTLRSFVFMFLGEICRFGFVVVVVSLSYFGIRAMWALERELTNNSPSISTL